MSSGVVHSLQNSKPFKNPSKNSGSKGTVQLYFDFSKGIAFDDDCDSFKFNSNNFDMSVITE